MLVRKLIMVNLVSLMYSYMGTIQNIPAGPFRDSIIITTCSLTLMA